MTLGDARQIAVLSFPALRRFCFPAPDTGGVSGERDIAGRTVLAALALLALTLHFEQGFDLRARCVLLPVDLPRVELLGRTQQERDLLALDVPRARCLLTQALAGAAVHGLHWHPEVITLHAHTKLQTLVERSRAVQSDAETLP